MDKKRINKSYFIFIIIAFVYAAGNFVWWTLNTPIIPSNISSIHFLDIFQPGWLFYNAPISTYIMRFMFFVFGKEYFDLLVIFVNYIFFLIPLYLIYKIGVEIKDKETGNIAMILFALVPAVYGLSRQYGHQEYRLMAATTFNMYCLIKSGYFSNRKWSVLYGISIGLGLMVKDEFHAYFLSQFIYAAFLSFKHEFSGQKLKNILTACLMGFLIACWHYLRPQIIEKIITDPLSETVPIFAFDSLSVMTIGLCEKLLSPPIFVFFIMGFVYFIIEKSVKFRTIILLWFIFPWTMIMAMPHHKLPEYGMGFVPALVLMAAVFIGTLKTRSYKKIIVVFIIILGFAQYLDYSYRSKNLLTFNLVGDKIKYFDLQLLAYDRKKSEFVSKTVDYFEKFYKDNSFCIEDCPMPYCWEEYFMLFTMMKIKGFNVVNGYIENKYYGLNMDIIVAVGKTEIIDGTLDERINRLRTDWRKRINKGYIEGTIDIFYTIKENYVPVDIFYPFESQDEKYKVTLFAKKTKN